MLGRKIEIFQTAIKLQYCPNMPEILSPAEMPGSGSSAGDIISGMWRQYFRLHGGLKSMLFELSLVDELAGVGREPQCVLQV